MTKIKNFKINLRTREIVRGLKKEHGLESTPELELAIEQMAKESKRWIEPAAVYTTLTRPIAEKTTSLVFPGKSIAVSVVAVSIGPLLGEQRLAAEPDSLRARLLSALAHEALSQTLQFAVRLLLDQAKEEECEMSAPQVVEEAAAASLAALVGVQRIGIALDQPSLPPYVRVAGLFWMPLGKGAKRAAEKVVA